MQSLSPEMTAHLVEGAAMIFFGWIGLQIKAAVAQVSLDQAKQKEELVEKQNELREDMDAKHAENSGTIKAHAAEDTQQFSSIGKTLQRIDMRADEQARKQETTALTLARIEGKLDRNGTSH